MEEKKIPKLFVYMYTHWHTYIHMYMSMCMQPFAYEDVLVKDRQQITQWSH